MHHVYLITRDDGKQYVGITNNLSRRKAAHKMDNRFKNRHFIMESIFESENRNECEKIEEEKIKEYDTFYNGLNKTISGKGQHHNSKNFTTLGKKFSSESKEKMRMNHWSKTGSYDQTGRKLSDETKKKISESNKGKIAPNRKISDKDIDDFLYSYNNEMLNITENDIRNKCAKKYLDIANVDNMKMGLLKTKSGHELKLTSFYIDHFAKLYKVTPTALISALKRRKENGQI